MALRPDADVTVNGWRNESGGTTLYASLNETTSNDATYIQSSDNPTNESFEVALSNPSGTPTNGPFKYRIFKKLNNAAVVNMKVALMQGATEIASWDHTDISNTPTEYSQTLTGPQFSTITDFTDLRIRGVANPTVNVTKAFGEGRTSYGANVSVNTFSGMSFPNPATGRICAVALGLYTVWTISSVTIGGVSAAERAATNTATTAEAHIFTAPVDAGTSLDVVITLNFHDTDTEFTVASYSMTGLSSAVPSSTAVFEFSNANPITAPVTVPTGGAAIAVALLVGSAGSNTWNVGTEDYDPAVGPAASGTAGSTSSSGAQALAVANSGALFGVMAAAAWGP